MIDGDEIVSCNPLGRHVVYDFEVAEHHNYLTAGLIHHNTEGAALYEASFHCRGWYPDWWIGIRYDRPLNVWVSGKTFKTTRDILMSKWLGRPYEEGTGILPHNWLDHDSIQRISGTGAIDTFRIKRHDGTTFSHVGVKTCEQGVSAYYGTEQDLIVLDEPHPIEIYAQCVARTRNRENPRIIYTVAPVEGRTETVAMFLNESDPSRKVITCGWRDAPHLTEEWKKDARANTPVYLIETIEEGIPRRGQGAVYPVLESTFVIDPVKISPHWPMVWGFDGGFHNTAAVWLAWDRDNDVVYCIADYKDGGTDRNSGEPIDYTIHVARIQARNRAYGFERMPGVGDAAARNALDGKQVLKQYQSAGCNLFLAQKARGSVDAGIGEVLERMANGRLKVFRNCVKLLDEFRTYSYDETNRVIKNNDHCLDALRYAIFSGLKKAQTKQRDELLIQQVTFS